MRFKHVGLGRGGTGGRGPWDGRQDWTSCLAGCLLLPAAAPHHLCSTACTLPAARRRGMAALPLSALPHTLLYTLFDRCFFPSHHPRFTPAFSALHAISWHHGVAVVGWYGGGFSSAAICLPATFFFTTIWPATIVCAP